MVDITNIKVRCSIGVGGVGGQIASFTQRILNQEYRGQDYDLVANRLEVSTYDTVRRVRTHLRVGVTIHLEENGVVDILIHPPRVVGVIKNEPPDAEESDAGEEAQEEQTEPPLAEILEEEEEIPHHRQYWPLQSKNDAVPRWGRTPSGTRSWRRRRRR